MALRARSLALSEYNCNDHREDEPSGYLEWHEWACKMGETHIQHRCPECGLYKIWISLKDVARLKAAGTTMTIKSDNWGNEGTR